MPGEKASIPSDPPALTPSARLLGWLIVALALFLRLLWLGMKPPHFDEGVNGWFIDQMTTHGFYEYDPTNFHGPFHFYVLFLAQTLFGRSIVVMRLPLILINTANVWLLLQFRRFIPWRVCVLAALAFAVSPGMLFYSRYAIHEAWLVFGMGLAVWGGAEMWTRGTARGLWAAAMGITLLILNKETHIIHLAAFGLAVATLAGLERFSKSSGDGIPGRPVMQQWSARTLCDALAVSLLLLVFFYSGGFLNPADWKELVKNFFLAFAVWSKTGVHGTDHVKEWYYWMLLIVRYEWPVLIGLAWSVRALWPGKNRLTRYLAIYGCGVLVAYSIVPYKTPWCIISVIWPFFFLFGSAVDSGMRFLEKQRVPFAISVLPGLTILGLSLAAACQLNYLRPTDPTEWTLKHLVSNKFFHAQALTDWIDDVNLHAEDDDSPAADGSHATHAKWERAVAHCLNYGCSYVYVQTTDDYFKLTRPLEKLISLDPAAVHMTGNILLSSYHPLPWTLGNFTSVGYYDKEEPPAMDAGFVLVEDDNVAKVEAQLKESYFVCPFQLRDGMDGGKLYLNAKRFGPVFPGREPEFVPKESPAP